MAQPKSPWTTISVNPTGPLDTRSIPADIPAGAFRYKLNWTINDTGKLARLPGFTRFYGAENINHDHHMVGASREPISFLFEATDNTGLRSLLDGSRSRVSVLNETTGLWTTILTVAGSSTSRWTCGVSQGYAILANGADSDPIYAYTLGSNAAASTIPDLANNQFTGAKVVIEFSGFILIMNFVEAGVRNSSRIKWSDLNLPLSFVPGGSSLAGFQDLDYGDEILAAVPMLSSIYIYTRRAIWEIAINPTANRVFTFKRRYYEPKNQRGCLVYPGTLVGTGSVHYYASRDSIYRYDPYVAEPERVDQSQTDWLHKAVGSMFSDPITKLLGQNCNSPVMEYVPAKDDKLQGQLWVSWASGGAAYNNYSMVISVQAKTASLVDVGFTAFVNYRQNPPVGTCNEVQNFVGASSRDWCLKSLGTVYVREFAEVADPNNLSTDNPLTIGYSSEGYNSVLRGLIPFSLFDREKLLRAVLLDHESTNQDTPCIARLRIGNSAKLEDSNSLDERSAPLWRSITPDLHLRSPSLKRVAQMIQNGLRPGYTPDWGTYDQGRFLYYEITVLNSDGTPAVGGETAWSRIDFDAAALLKNVI